jgi:hypothetical protein
MPLKPFVQNSLKGSKVLVLVENLSAQVPAIEGMTKSACFVGARWSWHRDFPCLVSKTGVYQRLGPKQRGLTPLSFPRLESFDECLTLQGAATRIHV